MPLDDFLPQFDVRSRHEVVVRAPPATVYRAVRTLDLGDSRTVRWLFALRGLPTRAITVECLIRIGFVMLGETPGRELVLGAVGRFWTPAGGLVRVDPAGFRAFATAGYAKAVWNFVVQDQGRGARLGTETRVRCLDAVSRRRFRLYWALIRPLSAHVRREALRLAQVQAETDAVRRAE